MPENGGMADPSRPSSCLRLSAARCAVAAAHREALQTQEETMSSHDYLRRVYRRMGEDESVPIIQASSIPVGAFLAPILAHTAVISLTTIERAKKEATVLALGKPSRTLIERHRYALS